MVALKLDWKLEDGSHVEGCCKSEICGLTSTGSISTFIEDIHEQRYMKIRFSNELSSYALISLLLMAQIVGGCFAGVSNENEKLNAILVGDWQKLQDLTSDAIETQHPLDLFLYNRSRMETNTSYYREFFVDVTDDRFSQKVELYNWLAKKFTHYPRNGYLAYLVAIAGLNSVMLNRDRAILLIGIAIEQDSTWPIPYIDRTQLYLLVDRQIEARKDFEVALQLGDSLCYLHIMKSLFEREDSELALQFLKPCLDINPDHATGLAVKAHLLGRLERFDGAIAVWKKSIEIEPWSCKLKFKLADCYERSGQFEQALNLYEKIAESEAPRYVFLRSEAAKRIDSIKSNLELSR